MTLQIFNGTKEIPHRWVEFSDGAKNLKLETTGCLETVFKDGVLTKMQKFSNIRERIGE